MKELTNKWIRALLVLLVATAVFSTSCTNDDEEDDGEIQSYEGKWTSNTNIFSDETSGVYKDIMTLTGRTFEDRIQTPATDAADKWEDSLVLKGTILASGNTMDVHVSEIGISVDPISGEPTGNITYFKEGSLVFGAIINKSGQNQDFKLEYSVSGDILTLKYDKNGDGDFSDVNESVEYTRLK